MCTSKLFTRWKRALDDRAPPLRPTTSCSLKSYVNTQIILISYRAPFKIHSETLTSAGIPVKNWQDSSLTVKNLSRLEIWSRDVSTMRATVRDFEFHPVKGSFSSNLELVVNENSRSQWIISRWDRTIVIASNLFVCNVKISLAK